MSEVYAPTHSKCMNAVYHVKPEFLTFSAKEAPKPEHLQLVALVDTDEDFALDHVYECTNHIDEAWHEKVDSDVWFVGTSAPRSTSVGDIITCPKGEVYIVDSIGFKHLPGYQLPKLTHDELMRIQVKRDEFIKNR